MVNPIPKWLKGSLKEEDLLEIKNAVKKAELKTSGEIVPMIVYSSCNTKYTQLIVVMSLLILLLAFQLLNADAFAGLWPTQWTLPIMVVAAVVIGKMVGKLDCIQRRLIFPEDLDSEPERRALAEFYSAGLNGTVGSTGILIFISMLERRVVVLADSAISNRLPPNTWDELVRNLISDIKSQNLKTGLTKAVAHCGELLQPEFPIQENDVNEIRNHLIIKE